MELFKRFKKDKKFRQNVIIGLIIFAFLTNNSSLGTQATWNPPPEAQCAGFHLTASSCLLDGCVWNPLRLNFDLCTNAIPNGEKIERINEYDLYPSRWPDQICASGCYKLITTGGIFEPYAHETIQCSVCSDPDASQPCKSWQKPFSKILDSIWKSNELDCPTGAYVAMGALGMVLMALM